MRGLGVRERAAVTARSHVASETSQDLDAICGTIAPNAFFAVPTRTAGGYHIDDTNVLVTDDAVRQYYSDRMGSYVIMASRQLKSLTTDWYAFNESAATVRGTGQVGGQDATGKQYTVQAAVLFPTATDGIRGEIAMGRHAYVDSLTGTTSQPARAGGYRIADDLGEASLIPLDELEDAVALDDFVLALRAGDAGAVQGMLAPDHCMAVRLDARDGVRIHRHTSGAESTEAFSSLFAGADDVAVLNRISTSWYNFAEYLVTLEGGAVRRLALIHGSQAGRYIGTFGYGVDRG
jgi:hypothetical protein